MFNKQKKYFERKLDGVQKMIWDLEFKRFKTLEIREEVRQEYDSVRSKLSVLETQIKAQKETPTMEKGEIARLDDTKVLFDKDIEKLKEQMKGLDIEVDGSKKTNEFPEGYQGITQQLEALRELQVMLKDYIKNI